MEITREQYLNALEIIDIYHLQLDIKSKKMNPNEIGRRIKDICSTRFVNALQNKGIDVNLSIMDFCTQYSVREISKTHNLGRKSIREELENFNNLGINWI